MGLLGRPGLKGQLVRLHSPGHDKPVVPFNETNALGGLVFHLDFVGGFLCRMIR